MEPAMQQSEEFQREMARLNDEPELPKPALKGNIVDRAVFVSIKLRKPGASKKIDSNRVTFKAKSDSPDDESLDAVEGDGVDHNMITVSKKLMDCKEYKAVTKIDSKLKQFIQKRCTPSLVRDGVFLLPIALVNNVDTQVQAFKTQREQAIEAYGAVYPERVKESLERLGSEGDARDYPPWVVVKGAFAFDVQYLSLGVPLVLGNVNQSIFEREQARVAEQFASALEIGKQGMRSMMADLVGGLTEKLTADPGEGKKIFRASLLEKMNDFLTVFDARNLSDDSELAELVKRSKKILEGVDAKELRTDGAVKEYVANGLSEIKVALSSMVIETPKRAITFDD